MILYDYVLSPSCYKVRLFAALTGADLVLRPVDFHPGKEHHSDELRTLNPAGTIPILVDEDVVLTDSAAILVYLAKKSGPDWLGDGSAKSSAQIQNWLSFAHRLTAHLGGARLYEMLHGGGDIEHMKTLGIQALRELEAALFEQRLKGQVFLTGETPTIADIACFPYVVLAPDGSISLDPYPSIRLWSRAIRSLGGFIEMPGIHRLHELIAAPDTICETAAG